MADRKAFLKEQAAQAGTIWDEEKLDDKDAKAISSALCAKWDIDEKQQSNIAGVLGLCLGDKPNKPNFTLFCQTFGPIDDGKVLAKAVLELWDAKKGEVHGWFHALLADSESCLKNKDYYKHGAFLIRFASDAGMLTINRLSEKKGQIVAAKSRLENRPDVGWYCQEKKKGFKTLQDYFTARGPPPGDDRLLIPVPRPAGDAKKAPANMYSPTF